MNETFMKEKPIFPLLLSMSLPMVISMAVNSLYNIVDSYFVAKISEDAMTALSLVFQSRTLSTSVAWLWIEYSAGPDDYFRHRTVSKTWYCGSSAGHWSWTMPAGSNLHHCIVVLIIPLAFIFSRFWGAVGVWHAFWVAEALTAVFAAVIYQRSVKE